MGNLWIAQFDSSSSSPSSTRPSSPGIAQNTSNEGTHSGTGSAFSSRLDEVSPDGQILPITPTLKIFSFAELKKATRNFSFDTLLGEGDFGRVFKGWIDENTFAPTKAGSGMAIAVKKFNSDGFQGRDEWLTLVNFLGSLSHPNIVRLLGHCEKDKELLLVYEFMPRGSLENHLFIRGSAFQTLSWSNRLKIAIGVARGLAFLHCSERKIIHGVLKPCDVLIDLNYNAKIFGFWRARNGPPQGENSHASKGVMGTIGYMAPELFLTTGGSAFQSLSWSIRLKRAIGVARGLAFFHCSKRKIIHRDLKPYNELIDSNYNAKLSNFGIARNDPPQGENSHVSTCVIGTIGYLAPEYVATGHLYEKSDVYSFGVVLLEMLSGMRAFDAERPSGQQNLVDWAKPYLSDQRKVSRLMDRRLEGYYSYEGTAQTAQLILKCLIHCPRNRPSMTEVAEALEKIHAPKHPLGPLWQLY